MATATRKNGTRNHRRTAFWTCFLGYALVMVVGHALEFSDAIQMVQPSGPPPVVMVAKETR